MVIINKVVLIGRLTKDPELRYAAGSYDAQDGTKRYTTDVAVESFEFIGSNGQANNQGNTQENTSFDGGWDLESDFTPVDDMGDMPF